MQKFRVFDVSTGVFATRREVGVMSEDEAIAYAVGATRQPEGRVRDALACGPTGNPNGAHRIPANSTYGGAGCVDLEPIEPPRFIVTPVSVGAAGLTERPAVYDRTEQRIVKVYRGAEQQLAERLAAKLNAEGTEEEDPAERFIAIAERAFTIGGVELAAVHVAAVLAAAEQIDAERVAEPKCAACRDSGVVEDAAGGEWSCVCPAGIARDRERHAVALGEAVERAVEDGDDEALAALAREPDAVEVAERREARAASGLEA